MNSVNSRHDGQIDLEEAIRNAKPNGAHVTDVRCGTVTDLPPEARVAPPVRYEPANRRAEDWSNHPLQAGREAEPAPAATGSSNPAAPPKAGKGPVLLTAAQFVAGYVPPSYLLDGILQRGRVYAVTGSTGHGKTAAVMTMSAHVALGRSIAGRAVEQGSVLYLSAENPDDVRARTIFMADRMGLDLDTLPLRFVAGSFDLVTDIGHARRLVAEMGGAALIVIDTGASFAAAGGVEDENSNMTMLRFALALRGLTELPGAPCVLALMHPVKRPSRQDELLPRGGGSFINEVDGNLTMFAEGDRSTTELWWTGKFRGPPFEPITFALEGGSCARLADAKGRLTPSVWGRITDHTAVEAATEAARRDEDVVLVAMAERPGSSMAAWAQLVGWYQPNGDPAKWRVQRAIARLAADNLATQRRHKWTLTKAGQLEAENAQRPAW